MITTPYFSGQIDQLNQEHLLKDEKLIIVLLAFNYIKTGTFGPSDRMAGSGACSFFNTVYSVGFGVNSSAAWANYHYNNQNDYNSGELINCVPLGYPEHSNYGVLHYVTRAYCCR